MTRETDEGGRLNDNDRLERVMDEISLCASHSQWR